MNKIDDLDDLKFMSALMGRPVVREVLWKKGKKHLRKVYIIYGENVWPREQFNRYGVMEILLKDKLVWQEDGRYFFSDSYKEFLKELAKY